MTQARISWWKFKPGMRDEGTKRMDGYLDEIRRQNGYMGVISMLSLKNPDRVTVISFWESEDAMRANQTGLFQRISDELSDILAEPPQVANHTVHTMDRAKIFA